MSQPTPTPPAPPDPDRFLDVNVPNMARIFDYLTGGTANFEVDRQAAHEMMALIPSLQKWVRLRRAFIQEAVRTCYDAGFRQFLDLGSGMPSKDHVHVAAPDARIIYSDINPVAVSYGSSLFSPQANIAYIQADARDFDTIVHHHTVRHLINLEEPIAIGLNALLLFLPPDDHKALAQRLYEWAPPGSQIFVALQTRGDYEMPVEYRQFTALTQKAQLPLQLLTLKECMEMLKPWQLSDLQPITNFLGLPSDFITEADREGIDMAFYAAFLSQAEISL